MDTRNSPLRPVYNVLPLLQISKPHGIVIMGGVQICVPNMFWEWMRVAVLMAFPLMCEARFQFLKPQKANGRDW